LWILNIIRVIKMVTAKALVQKVEGYIHDAVEAVKRAMHGGAPKAKTAAILGGMARHIKKVGGYAKKAEELAKKHVAADAMEGGRRRRPKKAKKAKKAKKSKKSKKRVGGCASCSGGV
jgi:hypothetical protein